MSTRRCHICHHPARRRYWARRGLRFRRVWLCSVDAFPSQRAQARREGWWV